MFGGYAGMAKLLLPFTAYCSLLSFSLSPILTFSHSPILTLSFLISHFSPSPIPLSSKLADSSFQTDLLNSMLNCDPFVGRRFFLFFLIPYAWVNNNAGIRLWFAHVVSFFSICKLNYIRVILFVRRDQFLILNFA